MKAIAVLITCHNRKKHTLDCLEALYKCQLPNKHTIEVYLVDDGSTDGTSEAITVRYPKVCIIPGTGSLYWNKGMHLAWRTAKLAKDFDYYIWLNDDTKLMINGIKELLTCELLKKGNLIVCGAVCSSISGEFTYGGRSLNGIPVKPNGSIQQCYNINGNCVLVSKAICDSIGFLDPIYPHAIGDYDYGLKAVKHGYNIISTRKYIGYCEKNNLLPKWCYTNIPLKNRINALYSPLGNSHPKYFFIFECRYYGLITAIKHYLSIHIRVLFPALWK